MDHYLLGRARNSTVTIAVDGYCSFVLMEAPRASRNFDMAGSQVLSMEVFERTSG